MGRRKVEIKKIDNLQARRVCFSKRRKGLFKKSREYSGLSNDDVLSIVFSSAGRPFVLNTSSLSVESLLERYMKMKKGNYLPSDGSSDGGEKGDDHELPEAEEEEEESETMNLKELQSLLKMDINALPADQLDEYLSVMEKLYETVSRARRIKEMTASCSNAEHSQEEYKGELILVILQHLYENNLKDSAHRLEQETGLYLNLMYLKDLVENGEWDEADKYLSGYTKIGDNRLSDKLFFEIRKQKYLETIDKRDLFRASDILIKNLKVFEASDEELFKELKQLLTFEGIREHDKLAMHEKTQIDRTSVFTVLKSLIENNPLLSTKLQFPVINSRRLEELINYSLLNQHHLCKNPRSNPEFKTLFVDHTCEQPSDSQYPSSDTNQLLGTAGPAAPSHYGGQSTTPAHLSDPVSSGVPVSITPPYTAGPSTTEKVVDYQSAESEPVLRKSLPSGMLDEIGEDKSLADDESGPSDGLTENSMITEP